MPALIPLPPCPPAPLSLCQGRLFKNNQLARQKMEEERAAKVRVPSPI